MCDNRPIDGLIVKKCRKKQKNYINNNMKNIYKKHEKTLLEK